MEMGTIVLLEHDGTKVFDCSNPWLPDTTSSKVKAKQRTGSAKKR